MGTYTEIYVNVDFKKDLPDDVIEVITAVCNKDLNYFATSDFPLRWGLLFNNGSYYTPYTSCAMLTYDETAEHWSLLGKGDIKNTSEEIEEFFEYIEPYVERPFMGYIMEEYTTPQMMFKPTEN